jgi:hypothetical protein
MIKDTCSTSKDATTVASIPTHYPYPLHPQGLSKSSTKDVITAAAMKSKQMDAWGASGGMPRV